MRGLDKMLYWKDAPRRRHWTHRLFTPRSTTQRVPAGAGRGQGQMGAPSVLVVPSQCRRSASEAAPTVESRLSRLVAVTDRRAAQAGTKGGWEGRGDGHACLAGGAAR